ncbi:MAG: energy transducer TonB [Bacteroidaceae bacterium]|nr:energy transducer TonB [Bacteroidaceae bacterium]
MKKKLMFAIAAAVMLLAGTVEATAQKQSTPAATGRGGEVYTPEQVDQRAMFPGGQEGMLSYMMQHMKYPKEAEKDKARGTVVVHFVVEADGSISGAHVPDSLSVHSVLDAAALQVVKEMPRWKPAKLKGKAVRQRATHAVMFRYQ